jgi:hypothetical protein
LRYKDCNVPSESSRHRPATRTWVGLVSPECHVSLNTACTNLRLGHFGGLHHLLKQPVMSHKVLCGPRHTARSAAMTRGSLRWTSKTNPLATFTPAKERTEPIPPVCEPTGATLPELAIHSLVTVSQPLEEPAQPDANDKPENEATARSTLQRVFEILGNRCASSEPCSSPKDLHV